MLLLSKFKRVSLIKNMLYVYRSLALFLSAASLLPLSAYSQTGAQQNTQTDSQQIAQPIAAATEPADTVLLGAMKTELSRAMSTLGKNNQQGNAASTDGNNPTQPPYFLSYDVADLYSTSITGQYGAILSAVQDHARDVDVQVRVGDAKLDNTHGTHRSSALNSVTLPLADDKAAIERTLWWATNRGYGKALETYLTVKTETEVRAKEEDVSPDFSNAPPVNAVEPAVKPSTVDMNLWEYRLRKLSGIFKAYPHVYANAVTLTVQDETDYLVSSEGSEVTTPYPLTRLIIYCSTRAEDGMDLYRVETYEARTPDGLPDEKTIAVTVNKLANELEALRIAPVTEPFNGPAILSGRAAAVFFHEVLGHRLEGERQRGEEEGQTFTKDVGKKILPDFLSVSDDPTMQSFNGTALSGHYDHDDEGQTARRVDLIQNGVLKTFLMSRLPIASFADSNGHGRAQTGYMPTGRQGNLIVSSINQVPEAQLRGMLIDEAKKQGKPYGLYFEDISSGFAVTSRRSPQAYSVIPLMVYRVYVDGRPDELVRGVSIVGTPLASLNRILVTGDKQDIFNGDCGAESGSIPVSAIAPAMLVSEMETQKQAQGTAQPPILPPPAFDGKRNGGAK
jgi:predicted Zn-dependent protease